MRAMLWAMLLGCGLAGGDRHQRRDGPAPGERTAIRGTAFVALGADARGEERSAFVHVPERVAAGAAAIIVLHGGSGSDARAIAPNWRDAFDRGIVLAFPNGQLRAAERGGWFSEDGDDRTQIDVVGRLIEALAREHGVDPQRIYVAGYSSGAMMVAHLLCEEPGWFAGAAMVSHKLREDFAATCGPAVSRVPLAYFMGTKDEEAGYGGRPGVTLGAEETLAFFVERAGCSATRAVVSALPDEPGDRTRVERWDYPSCPTPFRFFRIEGGGHSWPGGVAAQGATHCTDVDGTREIIRFWRESAGLAPS